jgi:hypothetical protein
MFFSINTAEMRRREQLESEKWRKWKKEEEGKGERRKELKEMKCTIEVE